MRFNGFFLGALENQNTAIFFPLEAEIWARNIDKSINLVFCERMLVGYLFITIDSSRPTANIYKPTEISIKYGDDENSSLILRRWFCFSIK